MHIWDKLKELIVELNQVISYPQAFKLNAHQFIIFRTICCFFAFSYIGISILMGVILYHAFVLVLSDKVALILSLFIATVFCQKAALISSKELNIRYADNVNFILHLIIFIVVLSINIIKYSQVISVSWIPNIEVINTAFVLVIAFSRVDKAHMDKKKIVLEKKQEAIDKNKDGDDYIGVMKYSKGSLYPTKRCPYCKKKPVIVTYISYTTRVRMYKCAHWCREEHKVLKSDLVFTRFMAIDSWNERIHYDFLYTAIDEIKKNM